MTEQQQLFAANDTTWPYGISYPFLREALLHWRDSYNWRREEALLNRHAQYTVKIVRRNRAA